MGEQSDGYPADLAFLARAGIDASQAHAFVREARRIGVAPEEVADAVAWLCLPSSRSVTGQSIVVAGGEVT